MIRIENMHLENFRGFEDEIIDFEENITCLAGINGCGKTTILDSVKISLSWLIEMMKPIHANGNFLKNSDVRKNSSGFSRITAKINVNGAKKDIIIGLDNLANNFKIDFADQPGLKELYKEIENFYPKNNTDSIPVLAYYTVNRSELDVDLSVEAEKDLSEMYSAYDNALNSVTHFKDFFKWYRDREDRENESQLEKYKSGNKTEIYEDIQLKAVRTAIKSFLNEYNDFKVARKTQDLILSAHGVELSINSLSDGEKGIIVLFGDIARRLSIANPNAENPLKGDGIILIDEIELHLHPEWQRKISSALIKTFPNCQFIVTTHSPQTLGEIKPKNIRLLSNFGVSIPQQSYGLDTNSILAQLMKNDSKTTITINNAIDKKIHCISKLIDEENFSDAKEKLRQLEVELNGSTTNTLELSTMITMLEGEE